MGKHLTIDFTLFLSLLQELETRIDTQKQTLQARDESIKKLLEMLQSKGEGKIIIYLSPIRAVKVATLSCQYVE